MSKINDGGPAYPHRWLNGDGCTDIIARGLSIRQWYAGQALAGIYQREIGRTTRSPKRMAQKAFDLADAMIAHEAKERDE